MSDNDYRDQLVQLSCHYDSLMWTVTSLWTAAIGALLVYSVDNFNPLIATFGLLLTVCAMYFAYSFRRYQRRVHAKLPGDFRQLLERERGARWGQWDVFALVFLCLVVLWGGVLIDNAFSLWLLWLVLTVIAVVFVCCMWLPERRRRQNDQDSHADKAEGHQKKTEHDSRQ